MRHLYVGWLMVVTVACSRPASRRMDSSAVETIEIEQVASAPQTETALRFQVSDGALDNFFFRDTGVAAHLVLRSGNQPRIVAAFPSANTGIGLWLGSERDSQLALQGDLEATESEGMRGIVATLRFDQAVTIGRLVLGSVRVLRDVNNGSPLPEQMAPEIENDGKLLRIRRTSLTGEHHYEIRLEAQEGTRFDPGPGGALRIVPARAGVAIVRASFLHDHTALTAIPLERLLTDRAAPLEREKQVLAFLSYEEKLLAGSWRFLTYFGRDTLLSTRLLLPALKPLAIEGALGSVLDRLNADGEVAHEEDIGDFAAWRHLERGDAASEEPVFDYKMVDDDFMLAPLLATYFLDMPAAHDRLAAFVAKASPGEVSYADAIASNLDFVLNAAAAFARQPVAKNLIPLSEGKTGDWRDSNEGLGGGLYSYSVNAVLMPAALEGAARLYAVEPWRDAEKEARAIELARAWASARDLFRVEVPLASARVKAARYARQYGLPLHTIEKPVVFWAVSLDARGKPIAVQNSDIGFWMLFGKPPLADLEHLARIIESPLPLGLHTPLGVVVANAAFLRDSKLAATFGPTHYHGAVVWSWQQALLAAGLERQLLRDDLPEVTRASLVSAQRALWEVIEANADKRASEYWSWQVVDGVFTLLRPGQGEDHESNAAQLWSTVFLAVRPPGAFSAHP